MSYLHKYLGKGVRVLNEAPELGLFALFKPSGSASHRDPAASSTVRCLIDAPYSMKEESFLTNDGPIHLLHRLDRETSGVVLVSTDTAVAAGVREAFRARNVTKIYKALAFGAFDESAQLPALWADQYVAPGYAGTRVPRVFPSVPKSARAAESPKGKGKGQKQQQKQDKDTRQAETIVISAEKKLISLSPAAGVPSNTVPATLFTLSPQTGYTHQLRLVLQARGHPIVGDNIYGNFALHKHLLSGRPPRMFLHALAIEAFFEAGGETHSFVASAEREDEDEHLEGDWRAELRGAVVE